MRRNKAPEVIGRSHAKGIERHLYLSGSTIRDTEIVVPDGMIAITLRAGKSQINIVDDPHALSYLFDLLQGMVFDGTDWTPRKAADANPHDKNTAAVVAPVAPNCSPAARPAS